MGEMRDAGFVALAFGYVLDDRQEIFRLATLAADCDALGCDVAETSIQSTRNVEVDCHLAGAQGFFVPRDNYGGLLRVENLFGGLADQFISWGPQKSLAGA